MFAPYVTEVELARSPQAVVFKGHAPDGRPVVLKLLLDPSRERRERFARERALLQELGDTKGFVPLLDVVDTLHGPCLVMPFLPGGTLRDRLRTGGTLRVHEAVRLVRRLAAAVGRAHARGVVHRDLKPENVLVDAQGEPMLADLGVARTSTTASSLTRTGELWGTPGYMPPEQISDAREVGPPADVFALGALLYECLTGVAPFAGHDSVDTLARTASGTFDPLGSSCPDAPRWLAEIVDRCLAPEPKRRYPDGAAVAAALAQGPLGRERRAGWPLAVGAVVAVAAAAAGLLLATGAPPPSDPPPPPSTDTEVARATEHRDDPEVIDPERGDPGLLDDPAPVDAPPAEVDPAEPSAGPLDGATPGLSLGLLEPQLQRVAQRGNEGPWRVSRGPDAFVFENDGAPAASQYHYVGFGDERRRRVVVEVAVEGDPASKVAGAGIICDFDPERRTYWAVVAAPDGSVRVFRHNPTAFVPRGSFGSSDPPARGARRRLEVTCLPDGISIRADGQQVAALRGAPRAPRGGVGIIVMSQGRFAFSHFSAEPVDGGR